MHHHRHPLAAEHTLGTTDENAVPDTHPAAATPTTRHNPADAQPESQQDGEADDALLPASGAESWAMLRSLEGGLTTGRILTIVSTTVLLVATIIATSTLWGRLVDLLRGQAVGPFPATTNGFLWMLIACGICMTGEVILRPLLAYQLAVRSRHIAVELRARCVSSVLATEIPTIMELGTGNVITRLTSDIDKAVNVVRNIGSRALTTMVMLPLSLVALSLIHWHYAILTVAVIVISVPALRYAIKEVPTIVNRHSVADAHRNATLLDTIRSEPTLRALSLEQWAIRRMSQASWGSVRAAMRQQLLLNKLLIVASILFFLLEIAGIILGVWGTHTGAMTVGQATAAVLLISRLEIHIFNLMMFAGSIQQAGTAFGRAVALAQLTPPETATMQGRPLPGSDEIRQADIVLDGVTVAYHDGAPVIDNCHLTFHGGTSTALVGASGAGKSTIAQVIAGLLRPTSGRILIGGVDTAAVSDTWLAAQVQLITQEMHVFSGTLRQDLHFAHPAADDAQLYKALAEVGLTPDTLAWQRSLPDGLDTLIGAGHDDLDPLVIQQITLARTLLADPPIVIMDEATSEANSAAGAALTRAATTVANSRTSIVVAHHLQQAQAADRIVFIDNGTVIEDGSPQQLLAAGGAYAQLYQRWLGTQNQANQPAIAEPSPTSHHPTNHPDPT
ncbi:ABC transporter ATP-binding protein [Corynebacterium choanae]